MNAGLQTRAGEEGFELAEEGCVWLRSEQGDEVAEEGDARRGVGVERSVQNGCLVENDVKELVGPGLGGLARGTGTGIRPAQRSLPATWS